MPAPNRRCGINRCFCLTSVAYIRPNSRTERPIGRLKWHRGSPRHMWLGHHFQGQKVKDTRPLWLVVLAGQHRRDLSIYVYMTYGVTTAGLQGAAYRGGRPPTACSKKKICNAQNRIFPANSLYSLEHFGGDFSGPEFFSADKKWRLIRLSATAKGSTIPLTSLIHYISFMSFSPFLGRLPKVDLIILEGRKMSVRTSVRPSVRPSVHKKFLRFQWYLVYR